MLLVARPDSWNPGFGRGRWTSPTGEPLSEFLQFASCSDDELPRAVLAFARTWGALDLCSCGSPGAGVRHRDADYAPDHLYHAWGFWEPVETWRRHSRDLVALMAGSRELQRGALLSEDCWAAIKMISEPNNCCITDRTRLVWSSAGEPVTPAQDQRADIVKAVETWMAHGGVLIRPDWAPWDQGITIRTQWSGLPGLLAVHLLSTMADRVHLCAGCGLPLVLKPGRRRPPSEGADRVWCDRDGCGNGEKWRRYQAERYKKPEIRAARRRRYLSSKGAKAVTDSQPSEA